MMIWHDIDWVLGRVRLVAQDDALTRLEFVGQRHAMAPELSWEERSSPTPLFAEAKRQLSAYALGKLTRFDLPLAPVGSLFQQGVWNAIASIEYGELLTYGDIAKSLGSPDASRAVGAATGRNPIGIVIPCHRVVGSTRQLTGYAGGLPRKVAMLRMELGASLSLSQQAHEAKENQMPANASIDQLRPGLL